MAGVEVKIAGVDENKTYSGQVGYWPVGVYRTYCPFFGAFTYILKDADQITFLTSSGELVSQVCSPKISVKAEYKQISNNTTIQSITFVGDK